MKSVSSLFLSALERGGESPGWSQSLRLGPVVRRVTQLPQGLASPMSRHVGG